MIAAPLPAPKQKQPEQKQPEQRQPALGQPQQEHSQQGRPLFTIIMTVFDTYSLLKHAAMSVVWQTESSWELLILADGPSKEEKNRAVQVVKQLQKLKPSHRIELVALPRSQGCYGNIARNYGLQLAKGKNVCWVNHDNLIAPEYLQTHLKNFRKTPACVSVVDIQLWVRDRAHGVYPRSFQRSKIDLLCFAVPLKTAREVDAFGGTASQVYAADWIVFEACSKRLPTRHQKQCVGIHF